MDYLYCKSRDSWKALDEPAHIHEKESCVGRTPTCWCAPHLPGPYALQSPLSPDLSFLHFILMEWSHRPSCIHPILPGVWGRVGFQVFCFFPFSAFDWAESQKTSCFVHIWIRHLKSFKLRQVLMSLSWNRKYYSWALTYLGKKLPASIVCTHQLQPSWFSFKSSKLCPE